MENMVFLKIRDKSNILLLSIFFMTIISCGSSKNHIEINNYSETEYFIKDYLSLPYVQMYIEDYDTFEVIIQPLKSEYVLIRIYPFIDKVVLNNNDFKDDDFFPQAYRNINGKSFFIDFQHKRPSNLVYDKLIEKNKIDSTYIWVEQGKISEEEGIIIDKLDDSILSQKYLVKKNKGKLELIYDWFGN